MSEPQCVWVLYFEDDDYYSRPEVVAIFSSESHARRICHADNDRLWVIKHEIDALPDASDLAYYMKYNSPPETS